MIGFILTIEQKNLLIGQQFAPDQYFNPVQDINNSWFIFHGEVDACVNDQFMWVKNLPEAEYIPTSIYYIAINNGTTKNNGKHP